MRDSVGHAVYQSDSAQLSTYTADVPLQQAGSLTVHVTIRPHAVAVLALGAVPGSRLPLLVGLLTLTAAMIGVTVMQLRREHELSRLRADFAARVMITAVVGLFKRRAHEADFDGERELALALGVFVALFRGEISPFSAAEERGAS